MFENKTEAQAREEILAMVAEYADRFHNQTKEFSPGDRIPYASRVYDKQEMVNLVDSSLEFWLTSGRYTDEFEKKLVEALEENNIFRGMATVIRTSSGTRKIPIAEDTGEASWIDEGEEIPESDTTFGQTMLSAYKLGTMIKISNELLNDSAFDLATYIARRFGVRMGNAEERAWVCWLRPAVPRSV